MSKVPTDIYPKKVYRCPCLMYVIKQIYDDSLRNYAEILAALLICKSASTLIFTTGIKNKEICFLMCDQHMSLTLRAETNYDCTSKNNDDFLFAELN